MQRSGKIKATSDYLILELLQSPHYDVRADGTIWTRIARTGQVFVDSTKLREAGTTEPSGYRTISYKRKKLSIHRIIYAKFLGALSEDLTINHKNGLPGDNRPENLELIPQGANNLHRFRVLKKPAVFGNCKITLEIANQIRVDHNSGMSYRLLVQKYRLAKSNISSIINNKTWINLEAA